MNVPPGPPRRAQPPPAPALWSSPIEADRSGARRARAHTARLLAMLDGELLENAQLVVSELVTNAILHGAGMAQLTIVRSYDHVRIEVVDGGGGAVHLRAPSLEGGGGFGLHIVAALARAWGHEPGPPTRVWAELAIGR